MRPARTRSHAPAPDIPVPTLLIIATLPDFDTENNWLRDEDLVRSYSCPVGAADARGDSLTVRGPADW